MGLLKGWKSSQTYCSFTKWLIELPNFPAIEQEILNEVGRVLTFLQIKPKIKALKALTDLCQVFQVPHRLKDLEAGLAHCYSKARTFIGRGGLIAAAKTCEIPLLIQLTPKYKQSETSILKFLCLMHQVFGKLLKDTKILGDAEFGTQAVWETIEHIPEAMARFESYGKSKTKLTLSSDEKKTRLVVERVISRLDGYFHIEHPRTLGQDAVNFHTQLCWLCDLLIVMLNFLTGNIAHPHAIRKIRG